MLWDLKSQIIILHSNLLSPQITYNGATSSPKRNLKRSQKEFLKKNFDGDKFWSFIFTDTQTHTEQ